MKKKKIFKTIASAIILGAVLTSCNVFSKSPKMEKYAARGKTPQITSFEELKLPEYNYSENAVIVGGDLINTLVIKQDSKYALFNAKTKKHTGLVYDSVEKYGTGLETFRVSKIIDGVPHFAIATAYNETDFSSTYAYSFYLAEDIVGTPEAYYRIKGTAITKIMSIQNIDTVEPYFTGSNVYFYGDYSFMIVQDSSYSDKAIITYKNYVYQHTMFVSGNASIYYFGEGMFLFQESKLVYAGEHPSEAKKYDYMELSSGEGYHYRLTTKQYNAMNKKVSNSSINEPIVSATSSESGQRNQEKMAGIVAQERNYVRLETRRVTDKIIDSNRRNIRVVTTDGKVIADLTKGEKMLTGIIDDLSIYVDSTNMTFIKNKSNNTIYAGTQIEDVMNNCLLFSDNYLYGAISSEGHKIDIKYQELKVGPSSLYGKRDNKFYRVAYNGVETRLNEVIKLDTLFYTSEYADYLQIKSYSADNANFAFDKAYQVGVSYSMNSVQESLLFTLTAPSVNPVYYIGHITF